MQKTISLLLLAATQALAQTTGGNQPVPVKMMQVQAATVSGTVTVAAMVLGAVPLTLATGAGAESRSPIGWVIVGGLLLGTLLTLFVIPVAYTLLSGKRSQSG